MDDPEPSNGLVSTLLACLIVLVLVLIFLYKKLKKESNGEYAIRNIVYKEGGVRDRVRGAAMALEARLGVQLWPHGDGEDDGEEMRDVRDVEADGGSRSDTEGDEEDHSSSGGRRDKTDEGSSLGEEEEEEEDDDDDDDEQAKLMDEPEEHAEAEGTEDKQDRAGGKSGRAELLIDLNHFSGSAIWSGEQGGADESVTATVL